MSENDTYPERPDQPWRLAPESSAPQPPAGHPSAAASGPAESGSAEPGTSGPGGAEPGPGAPHGQPYESPSSPPGSQYPAGGQDAQTSAFPAANQPGHDAPGQQPPAGYPSPVTDRPGYPAPAYGHPAPPSGQPGYPAPISGYPAPTTGQPGYPAPTSAPGHPASGPGYPTSGYPYPGQYQGQPAAHGAVPGPGGPEAGPHPGGAYGPPPPPYGHGDPYQPYYGPTPQPRRRAGRAVATGLLALLLAGGGGVIGGLVVHAADDNGTTTSTSAPRGATQVLDRSSLASVVAGVKPSVVAITTQTGEGSGIVLNSDGYIVTNNHVVADAGNTVNVNFSDGTTMQAKVIGTDARTDIGVVKVDNAKDLTPAKFGDSNNLQVGDTVVAIGSPLGLEGSVTAGIVSALNRTINESDEQGQNTGVAIAGAIQTDAAINPGNSGGALVNLSGEVIGINTAILTSGQGEGNIGVGFAIPGNRANEVAQAIIKGQKVSHPYLGISVGTADNNGGAQVGQVTDGSPAASAGLKAGDVITKAGSTNIHTSDDLLNIVQSAKVGDKLQLAVKRGGSSTNITVTIGEAPN